MVSAPAAENPKASEPAAQPEDPRFSQLERIHPDAKLWGERDVERLQQKVQRLMDEGDFDYARGLAVDGLSRSFRDYMQTRGMGRVHHHATLALALRAAEYAHDSDEFARSSFEAIATDWEQDQARYAENDEGMAEAYYEGVGRLGRLVIADPHIHARILTHRAVYRIDRGEVALARGDVRRAQELLAAGPGATDLDLARARWVHGATVDGKQDSAAGLDEVRAGLAALEKLVPAHHPELRRPLRHLSTRYMTLRSWPRAVTTMKRLHDLQVNTGWRSRETIGWLELTLGGALGKAGSPREAKKMIRAGLGRFRPRVGEDSAALAEDDPGDSEEAKRRKNRRQLDLAVALETAASAYLGVPDIRRAKATIEEASAILEKLGDEAPHEARADTLMTLGRVRRAQKRPKDALALLRRAALGATLKLRKQARYIARTQCLLYLQLREMGQQEEAEKHRAIGQPIAEREFPADHIVLERFRTGKWKER